MTCFKVLAFASSDPLMKCYLLVNEKKKIKGKRRKFTTQKNMNEREFNTI